MNNLLSVVSLLASSIVIFEFLIKICPFFKNKLKRYFPTNEQVKKYLAEYCKEANSINRKMDYYFDYIKLFKITLINKTYHLNPKCKEYGKLTNYLFEDFQDEHTEIFYGLNLVKKKDYIEITLLAKCFNKRMCRKASIRYLNKILKEKKQ